MRFGPQWNKEYSSPLTKADRLSYAVVRAALKADRNKGETVKKQYREVLRMQGERDACAGKSIDSFQEIPAARLTESMRAEYEIGYRAAKQKVTAFDTLKFELLAKGWRVYQEPILRIVDDTWTFRLRSDSLDFLFVSESGEWQRQRFTREPFGDYTNCYQPKGSGKDFASLLEALR